MATIGGSGSMIPMQSSGGPSSTPQKKKVEQQSAQVAGKDVRVGSEGRVSGLVARFQGLISDQGLSTAQKMTVKRQEPSPGPRRPISVGPSSPEQVPAGPSRLKQPEASKAPPTPAQKPSGSIAQSRLKQPEAPKAPSTPAEKPSGSTAQSKLKQPEAPKAPPTPGEKPTGRVSIRPLPLLPPSKGRPTAMPTMMKVEKRVESLTPQTVMQGTAAGEAQKVQGPESAKAESLAEQQQDTLKTPAEKPEKTSQAPVEQKMPMSAKEFLAKVRELKQKAGISEELGKAPVELPGGKTMRQLLEEQQQRSAEMEKQRHSAGERPSSPPSPSLSGQGPVEQKMLMSAQEFLSKVKELKQNAGRASDPSKASAEVPKGKTMRQLLEEQQQRSAEMEKQLHPAGELPSSSPMAPPPPPPPPPPAAPAPRAPSIPSSSTRKEVSSASEALMSAIRTGVTLRKTEERKVESPKASEHEQAVIAALTSAMRGRVQDETVEEEESDWGEEEVSPESLEEEMTRDVQRFQNAKADINAQFKEVKQHERTLETIGTELENLPLLSEEDAKKQIEVDRREAVAEADRAIVVADKSLNDALKAQTEAIKQEEEAARKRDEKQEAAKKPGLIRSARQEANARAQEAEEDWKKANTKSKNMQESYHRCVESANKARSEKTRLQVLAEQPLTPQEVILGPYVVRANSAKSRLSSLRKELAEAQTTVEKAKSSIEMAQGMYSERFKARGQTVDDLEQTKKNAEQIVEDMKLNLTKFTEGASSIFEDERTKRAEIYVEEKKTDEPVSLQKTIEASLQKKFSKGEKTPSTEG